MDSNVFIEGKKGPYGFDIAPRFWSIIDKMTNVGRISCPIHVYNELLDVQDDLSNWVKARRRSGLFLEPETAVQEAFMTIVDYVNATYPDTTATRAFLNGADPWVIAHALAGGGKVVTMEVVVPPSSQKVKIPNVCNHFEVESLNTYQMLRELGVSW